jgi:tetratricopeptide (TPR) repeat protein
VWRVGRSPDDRRRAPTGARTDDFATDVPATGRGGGNVRRETDLPPVPDHADVSLLDRGVRAELRSLSKPNAEAVGKHLVAAGELLDTDPVRAFGHARAARARAGRVGAVREAVGIAAYRAGEWTTALSELRTARRISGDPRDLPLIADSERALGRPEAAVRLLSDPDVRKLDAETRAELLIVGAGARRDLGQLDAALAVLARGGLDRERPRPGAMRLWYAYADALEAAGRRDEAAQWFAASAALDRDGELDAAERAADLL